MSNIQTEKPKPRNGKLHSKVTRLSQTNLGLDPRSLTLRLEQLLPLSGGQPKQDPALVPSLPPSILSGVRDFLWPPGWGPAICSTAWLCDFGQVFCTVLSTVACDFVLPSLEK